MVSLTCESCGSGDLVLVKRISLTNTYQISNGEMIDRFGSDGIVWDLDCPKCRAHLPVSRADEVAVALLSPEERCYPDCDGKCGLGHIDLRR
jgi:hypothetical protein